MFLISDMAHDKTQLELGRVVVVVVVRTVFGLRLTITCFLIILHVVNS